MTMQSIGQWTGGNGITYYVTSIFKVCRHNQRQKRDLLTILTVRGPNRRCRIPCRLRRLRRRETALHNGLHVGTY
jgi:hypothetical protein